MLYSSVVDELVLYGDVVPARIAEKLEWRAALTAPQATAVAWIIRCSRDLQPALLPVRLEDGER